MEGGFCLLGWEKRRKKEEEEEEGRKKKKRENVVEIEHSADVDQGWGLGLNTYRQSQPFRRGSAEC